MAADAQIDDLLRQSRFKDAFILMECIALEGGMPDEAQIRALPEASLHASSLLTQALGEIVFLRGEYHEAKRLLEQAVKGYGAMAYPAGMLSAMCALVHVLLRLGECPAAATLLEFLREEYDRKPAEERSGELPFALAAGSRLIGGGSRVKRWYMEAVDLYEQQLRLKAAALALAELLQCGPELEPSVWEGLAWRLQRWTADSEVSAAVLTWILALRDAQLGQWERVYSRLRPYMHDYWKEQSMVHPAYVRLLYLRAAILSGSWEAAAALDGLRELRQQYPVDLRLQHAALLALSDGCRRFGLSGEADEAMSEAGFIGRYLMLPADAAVSAESLAPAHAIDEKPADEQTDQPKPEGGWRVSFFGGLSFGRGADAVRHIRWKRKKAQELCMFLLLQPNYTCPREQLTELLQLGESPEKANKSLYVIIHQLKQTLYDELSIRDGISTREGLVGLREEAFEHVDVERYLTLVRVADQLWLKDWDLAYELYQEAFALYDDLLPEFPYFTWLDNRREYVLDKQISVIRKLCQLAAKQRDSVLEEIYCQEWIRLRPYQEEAYQQLMRLLIRSNRMSEMGFVYDRFAARCRDELGTEPSEEIRALFRGRGIEHFT
ncbi:bacterial transcriptional activator domain-containing protein [Paenibacillus alkaliterrae]|uniref:AfsR/SARP family transcriptional regulator n=1 Tax=Paenibacillus alkaliterrae TaxID=320909 RepID=UPI001F30009A|nr:bacterial transcriptional activator domain-containing protein [Paenibacillus alkaliterrae]MCF2939398.1 bacterial transcriptional activator domain-containing protein [Paenibacillus alkaliterrae]